MTENLIDFVSKIENFKSLKASEKVDYFAYYLLEVENQEVFNPLEIIALFNFLKLVPLTNIGRYLRDHSDKAKPKKKKIKFLKTKSGYHIEGNFCSELGQTLKDVEVPFINYAVKADKNEWKPSDIPFVNSKVRSNAEFFAKIYFLLYHLENSLRKFLTIRLASILGTDWESKVCQSIDLAKAQSIRHEVSLSEMLPKRGDTILYYCMWDDYGKFLQLYPHIFNNPKETQEVLAHLHSLAKIRNAIAHNASTIPKEYQEELTVFLKKYIKIMKAHSTEATGSN